MDSSNGPPSTAFIGHRMLASGPLRDVLRAVKSAGSTVEPLLIFDDGTGAVVERDPREAASPRHETPARQAAGPPHGPPAHDAGIASAGSAIRGRPRLGVVAREVTLLPRHWDWLNAQPGGASVTLRRLVDRERREGGAAERQRRARESAYRVMSVLAGDLPGFEEAARALFAGDAQRCALQAAAWPGDVRDYVLRLAFPAAPDAVR